MSKTNWLWLLLGFLIGFTPSVYMRWQREGERAKAVERFSPAKQTHQPDWRKGEEGGPFDGTGIPGVHRSATDHELGYAIPFSYRVPEQSSNDATQERVQKLLSQQTQATIGPSEPAKAFVLPDNIPSGTYVITKEGRVLGINNERPPYAPLCPLHTVDQRECGCIVGWKNIKGAQP